ncbi:MAG: preprotein translocase subunit SecG, partial [Caulobacteraceae bacterium]|nr:preprotein translocase subunit SecG [Caulobacteraceae bacterium]
MLSGLLIGVIILVCLALIGVVLLQRSEGGAFGMGGGPSGLITTRGAGDLLTRTTWILFTIFVLLCLGMTLLDAHNRGTSSLLERMKNEIANPNALNQTPPPAAPAPGAPAAPAPGQQAPVAPFAPVPMTPQGPFAPSGGPVFAPGAPAPAVSAQSPAHAARRAKPAPAAAAGPIIAPPPTASAPSTAAPSAPAPSA